MKPPRVRCFRTPGGSSYGAKKPPSRRHLSQVYQQKSWALFRSEKRSKPWLYHPFAQSGLTSLNFSYLTSWDLSFFQQSPLRHSCNHFSNIFICGSRVSRKWDPLVLECRFPDPQWSSPDPTSSSVIRSSDFFVFLSIWYMKKVFGARGRNWQKSQSEFVQNSENCVE